MSGDLPLQILDVTLQRANEPQQLLALLLQLVYVCALVINLSLQTVELNEAQMRSRMLQLVL